MNLSTYLTGIGLSTVLCWIAFTLTLLNVDPKSGGVWTILSFFASLFFALAGTIALLGFVLRRWLSKNEAYYENITISFRQGILASISVIGVLLMQALRILNIFDGILFVLSIILLEFYFLARRV